jgi:hypothetical protein
MADVSLLTLITSFQKFECPRQDGLLDGCLRPQISVC